MSKVFRLFQDANLEHWSERSGAYNQQDIEKIPTPDGDETTKEPTSIPSPFARIDLIRTAFRNVVNKKQLNKNSVYTKMVSDTLDLIEMTFNKSSVNQISFHYWDKERDLENLLSSSNPKHQLYGKTLKLYLDQDKEVFNFDLFKGFYLIKYNHQVIGGTSPLTLFFTTANNLSSIDLNFHGSDKLFDSEYCPLYNRDEEFQKYIYRLFYSNSILKSKMKDFYDYIELSLEELSKINHSLFEEIHQIKSEGQQNLIDLNTYYDDLDTDISGQNIDVLGVPLKIRRVKQLASQIQKESDFLIDSEKFNSIYTDELLPLVLQNSYNTGLNYTSFSAKWNQNFKVPYYDSENEFNKRTLPNTATQYPYITVSDFLEPYIFNFEYPLNPKYFNGNITRNVNNNISDFALPLTRKFFDFFSIDDLLNKKVGGLPMLEMKSFVDSIDVILRIPIKSQNRFITFNRRYVNKGPLTADQPDLINNQGFIERVNFSLGIFPFVKTNKRFDAHYRIGIYDFGDIDVKAQFIDDKNETVKKVATKLRSNKQSDFIQSEYSIVENEFDYIDVSLLNRHNVIVPKWTIPSNNSEVFSFAIDFGTTNTHIEYRKGEDEPKAFDITKDDIQLEGTISSDYIEKGDVDTETIMMVRLMRLELLPGLINAETEFKFPTRTVISYAETLNKLVANYALADYSIPFQYEKLPIQKPSIVKSNLKWANINSDDMQVVEVFLEELVFLIKNKILLNNGDIKKTQIKWSYPISMNNARLSKFESSIEDLIDKYLKPKDLPKRITESIAPFQYLIKKEGISSLDKPVASIDIGGGTTDIVIYNNDVPQIITSFRYGANAIFGDGYNKPSSSNGFIKTRSKIDNILEENNELDLQAILKGLSSNKSEDISTFLFSLETNKNLNDKNVPLSYSAILSDSGDLKTVFLFYYSSIIYHLAKLMIANNLEAPKYVTFSGNGSKLLSIIDNSRQSRIINEFTKLIFEKVYAQNLAPITIKQYKNPKEITCKGMLYSTTELDVLKLKYTLLGDKNNSENIKYTEIETVKVGVLEETTDFINLFFDLNKEFSFKDNFEINIDKLNNYREYALGELKGELLLGIQNKLDELEGELDTEISEPLFFYPLVGILNSLASHISKN